MSTDNTITQMLVSVGGYTGQHVLGKTNLTDIRIAGGGNVTELVRGKFSTLPMGIERKLAAAANLVRTEVRRLTLPLKFTSADGADAGASNAGLGVRLVPTGSIVQVMERLDAVKQEHDKIIADVIEQWDQEVIDWNLARWSPYLGNADIQKLIISKIPTREEAAARFRVSFMLLALTPIDVKLIGDAEHNALVREAAEEARRRIDAAVDNSIRDAAKQIVDEVASLSTRLAEDTGRIYPDTFNNVISLLNIFGSLNGVLPDEVVEATRALSMSINNALANQRNTPRVGATITIRRHSDGITTAAANVLQSFETHRITTNRRIVTRSNPSVTATSDDGTGE